MRALLFFYLLSVASCNILATKEQGRETVIHPAIVEHHDNVSAQEENKDRNREWGAATYRSLTVGKSTSSDILHAFGKPKRIDIPAGQTDTDQVQEVWYTYEGVGEFPGELTIYVDKSKDRVVGMTLHPENLSKEEAINHFGSDYITMKYNFCEGFEDEDAAPIYESPDGLSLTSIEYRARGIAIDIDGEDVVRHIDYVNKPIGLVSREDCKKEIEKLKGS